MARNISAGLLMCRLASGEPQYFLVHPGGPYFQKKDAGVWTIPKGLPNENEPLLGTAQREFLEETGIRPSPPFSDLGAIKQKGGKHVYAWAFIGQWDPGTGITCNEFMLEWPPRSGKKVPFPEVDRAGWFTYEEALVKIIREQIPLLERARDVFRENKALKNN